MQNALLFKSCMFFSTFFNLKNILIIQTLYLQILKNRDLRRLCFNLTIKKQDPIVIINAICYCNLNLGTCKDLMQMMGKQRA